MATPVSRKRTAGPEAIREPDPHHVKRRRARSRASSNRALVHMIEHPGHDYPDATTIPDSTPSRASTATAPIAVVTGREQPRQAAQDAPSYLQRVWSWFTNSGPKLEPELPNNLPKTELPPFSRVTLVRCGGGADLERLPGLMHRSASQIMQRVALAETANTNIFAHNVKPQLDEILNIVRTLQAEMKTLQEGQRATFEAAAEARSHAENTSIAMPAAGEQRSSRADSEAGLEEGGHVESRQEEGESGGEHTLPRHNECELNDDEDADVWRFMVEVERELQDKDDQLRIKDEEIKRLREQLHLDE